MCFQESVSLLIVSDVRTSLTSTYLYESSERIVVIAVTFSLGLHTLPRRKIPACS